MRSTIRNSVRWSVFGTHAWLTLAGSPLRRMARQGFVLVAHFLLARPRLAQPARRLIRCFPVIRGRVKMILLNPQAPQNKKAPTRPVLSQHARYIYAELKLAMAKREDL
jgi:hypothetical protein